MDNQEARKLKRDNLGVKYIQIKSLTNFTKRDFMFLIKVEQLSTHDTCLRWGQDVLKGEKCFIEYLLYRRQSHNEFKPGEEEAMNNNNFYSQQV